MHAASQASPTSLLLARIQACREELALLKVLLRAAKAAERFAESRRRRLAPFATRAGGGRRA
jgi:hypothetical protein